MRLAELKAKLDQGQIAELYLAKQALTIQVRRLKQSGQVGARYDHRAFYVTRQEQPVIRYYHCWEELLYSVGRVEAQSKDWQIVQSAHEERSPATGIE